MKYTFICKQIYKTVDRIQKKLVVNKKLSGCFMEDLSLKIGKRIRHIRQAKKIKLKELASAIGMDSNYLGKIELGKVKTSLDNFYLIAKGLNVPFPVLLNIDGTLSRTNLLKNLTRNARLLTDESLLILVSLSNELSQQTKPKTEDS